MTPSITPFVLLLLSIAFVQGNPLARSDGNMLPEVSTESTLSCSTSLDWGGIRLVGTNPRPYVNGSPTGPIPMYTVSNSACRSACSTYLGYARMQSNGNCWCVVQPLGGGSITSADKNSDFVTGFNANVSPPSSAYCEAFRIQSQRIGFTTYLTYRATKSDNECAAICGVSFRNMWTRDQGNGDCQCNSSGSGAFQRSALEYNVRWNSGIISYK